LFVHITLINVSPTRMNKFQSLLSALDFIFTALVDFIFTALVSFCHVLIDPTMVTCIKTEHAKLFIQHLVAHYTQFWSAEKFL